MTFYEAKALAFIRDHNRLHKSRPHMDYLRQFLGLPDDQTGTVKVNEIVATLADEGWLYGLKCPSYETSNT